MKGTISDICCSTTKKTVATSKHTNPTGFNSAQSDNGFVTHDDYRIRFKEVWNLANDVCKQCTSNICSLLS